LFSLHYYILPSYLHEVLLNGFNNYPFMLSLAISIETLGGLFASCLICGLFLYILEL
jgi:hypothetical protein